MRCAVIGLGILAMCAFRAIASELRQSHEAAQEQAVSIAKAPARDSRARDKL
jgi:hypothetical protein